MKPLPAGPLRRRIDIELAGGRLLSHLAEDAGVDEHVIRHLLTEARIVDAFVADRLAIAIGYHPIQLWPDEWLDGDGEPMLPSEPLRSLVVAHVRRSRISVGEFARAARLDRQAVHYFLTRAASVSLHNAGRLARAIPVDLDSLYPGARRAS